MKFSQLLVPTLKEVPKDAEIASHRLMVRAGLIRKVASGIYTILPLGLKALQKLEAIIREELTKIGAQEVLMPSIIPSELWEKSERWDLYGKELLRMQDRMGRDFCYGPTHEEVITTVIGDALKSYKQLPVTLYQIQTKFRDEIRPRFGLMRAREFAMKDAYSFHSSQESLDDMYQKMAGAYSKIFERCGLKFQAVKADSGSIGGDESAEYMVLADTGEDEVLVCDGSEIATNKEAAATCPGSQSTKTDYDAPELVSTPNMKSIDDVSSFLNQEKETLLKSLLYKPMIAYS